MNKIIYLLTFLILGCSHIFIKNEENRNLKDSDKTVEVSLPGKNEAQTQKHYGETGEFIANKVKANRNKSIGVYVGPIAEKSFVALGVLKWLERNGYKIEKLNIESSNESYLFSPLISKKTSFIEWKLYQCCRTDFPLAGPEEFPKIIEKFSNLTKSEKASFDYSSCGDFTDENYNIDTLCIENGLANDNITLNKSIEGMRVLNIKLEPINFNQKSSLVDLIDKGFAIMNNSKTEWGK